MLDFVIGAHTELCACDMTGSKDDNHYSFGITKETVTCHLQSKSVVKHDKLPNCGFQWRYHRYTCIKNKNFLMQIPLINLISFSPIIFLTH